MQEGKALLASLLTLQTWGSPSSAADAAAPSAALLEQVAHLQAQLPPELDLSKASQVPSFTALTTLVDEAHAG